MQQILVVMGLLVLLCRCANEKSSMVNQDGVYTSYVMSYEDETKTFRANATFNFGGSTGTYLILDGTGEILFDGERMREIITPSNQVYYSLIAKGWGADRIFSQHEFRYTNNDGKIYKNSSRLPPIPTGSYPDASVSVSSRLSIGWHTSEKVGKGTIYITASRVSDGIINTEYAKGDLSTSQDGSVEVNSDRLVRWGIGDHNIQLCQDTYEIPNEMPREGGILQLSVCSSKHRITLVP